MASLSDWLQDCSDPYAILGVSLTADDKRILKQYRTVAKLLHPDRYVGADPQIQTLVGQLIARLINPAYAQLKQENHRAETIALLRLKVKRMAEAGQLVPTTEVARQLMRQPVQSAEIFYEQQVTALAATQYQSLDQFEPIIQQLRELNWVYLQLKLGDSFLREKRSGLIGAEITPPSQHQSSTYNAGSTAPNAQAQSTSGANQTNLNQTNSNQQVSYAHRHYDRAQQYMQKCAYDKAIHELRDAIRMDSQKSDYHALLSYAYLCQDLSGMATVYCRQALKLDAENKLAQQLSKKLKLQPPTPTPASAKTEKRRLFGLFNR
jgi:curved DNA-binding protein CbpA